LNGVIIILNSHGKIVIPKIKALKITDIAKSLGKAYGHKDIKLKYIGIRPGEKLHEAMISQKQNHLEQKNMKIII
jgi:UDP-N-acetylglucosamine 4,6-dehydratase